jgi:hypothetical protein
MNHNSFARFLAAEMRNSPLSSQFLNPLDKDHRLRLAVNGVVIVVIPVMINTVIQVTEVIKVKVKVINAVTIPTHPPILVFLRIPILLLTATPASMGNLLLSQYLSPQFHHLLMITQTKALELQEQKVSKHRHLQSLNHLYLSRLFAAHLAFLKLQFLNIKATFSILIHASQLK